MATTMHWLPKTFAPSVISSGRSTAAVLSETLSAPARRSERTSSMEPRPPPTVSGMKTSSSTRRTVGDYERLSEDAVSREGQLVRAFEVVARACSTGSPASTSERKRIPFTTRRHQRRARDDALAA